MYLKYELSNHLFHPEHALQQFGSPELMLTRMSSFESYLNCVAQD